MKHKYRPNSQKALLEMAPLESYQFVKIMKKDMFNKHAYADSFMIWYLICSAYARCWGVEKCGRKKKWYVKQIIKYWQQGDLFWGNLFKDEYKWYCGSKQCDFLFIPNHPNMRIQDFIKIYNKFSKKKIELKDKYPGITYLGREYVDTIK